MNEQQRNSAQAATEAIGRAIVVGKEYRPGHVLRIEEIEQKLAISRAMAREVLQALHSMRLVDLKPRVGATVQALHSWNVLHPAVIEWRLDSASSERLWKSLTQLRGAVEPAAARLAATRAPADICRDLVTLAFELKELGETRPFDKAIRGRYRDVDARFHAAMLAGSLNEMFVGFTDPVIKVLNHRIDQELPDPDASRRGTPKRTAREFPDHPEAVSLWLHVFLAQAIEQGQSRAAEFFSRGILAETLGDLRTDQDLDRGIAECLDDVALTEADREQFRVELARALAAEDAVTLGSHR